MVLLVSTQNKPDCLVEPGYFAKGGIHIISGSPYAGKSTLVAQIIKGLLTGTSFLSGLSFNTVAPEEIGIIFTDRRSIDNNVWLDKENINVPAYSLVDDPSSLNQILSPYVVKNQERWREEQGVHLLRYCIEHLRKINPQVKYIFADVMTNAFVGANIMNPHLVSCHMHGILQLCAEKGVTIFGTAYGSKQKSGKQDRFVRLVDRIIGAAPLRGSATDLLYITTKEETNIEGYQQLQWYSRHGAEQTFTIIRDPKTGFFVQGESSIEIPPEELPAKPSISRRLQNAMVLLEFIPEDGIKSEMLFPIVVPKLCSKASFYNWLEDLQTNNYINMENKHIVKVPQN